MTHSVSASVPSASTQRVAARRRVGMLSGRSSQRGVGMIEVLISFFVLAIGLLGLATLQMKTLQYNQGAYLRSQATVSAYDMLDRMRVNLVQVKAGAYAVSYGGTASGSGIAGTDLSAWQQSIANNLPDGQVEISCDANQLCTIGVRWLDRFSQVANAWDEVKISSQM